MAAANTYTQIASTTLGSATASVTFSSIAGTYTDLVLVINAGNSSGSVADTYMRLNSDSASNYSSTYMYGNGTSAASGRNSSQVWASAGYPLEATLISTLISHFQNYANTTTNKTILTRGNGTTTMVHSMVSLWRSTAAISTIYLQPSSGNFLSGSTFNLYGITAA